MGSWRPNPGAMNLEDPMATVTKLHPVVPAAFDTSFVVRFDRVDGSVTCYPVSAQAQAIARLAGKKTLSPSDIKTVRAMGFDVRIDAASQQLLAAYLGEPS